MSVGCSDAILLKEAGVPSPESSRAHGMAASGPSTSKKDVDDVDIYSDLTPNDDVSLDFSHFLC